ncbi:pentatricopeptide repeat-containing protein at5g24830 [Phtheirospermum japonicum]|uniref:Pentatricopeptide repeat-containing protein at5g24830 n=1 Tax=Phtheirospermum japonicum TaxID=374723 RepID=A0A830DC85_9LAMI|nr:pentatricopeptide repeat-containing protein at5g24830 [Phtheirospermum japonicum]
MLDPLLQPSKRPSPAASFRTMERDDDDDFESPVRVSYPPRSFKRLHRGPTSWLVPEPRKVEHVANEEIEDLSSDEDWPRVTYNLLIGAACDLGDISFALQMYDEMLRRGYKDVGFGN